LIRTGTNFPLYIPRLTVFLFMMKSVTIFPVRSQYFFCLSFF
jgi:hypothetical protein